MTIARALIVMSTAAVFLSPPLAAQQGSPNPWRDCGIGAAIFPDNPTAAAISNLIWDSGTTAVTSAVTTPNSCSGEAVRVAQFIQLTLPVLAMETAIGEGEHLVAILQLAGCEPLEFDRIGLALRNGLGQLIHSEGYESAAYEDRALGYYLMLREATSHSAACQSVI